MNKFFYIGHCAGVVKLVDARDSKSRGPQAHVGSIPTSGTNFFISSQKNLTYEDVNLYRPSLFSSNLLTLSHLTPDIKQIN